jgi:phage tail sheath gpL-like
MPIKLETISLTKRTPGVDTEANLTGGNQRLAGTHQKLMIVGQRMSALISIPSILVGTLNDCILGTNAAFAGNVLRKFIVTITTAAATDIFKWSNDGGATWTTGVNCATANTAIGTEGVTIKFGAITGHALGDSWNFFALPAGAGAQKIPTAFQSLADVSGGCGAGSVLYRMAKIAFAMVEQYGPIDMSYTSMSDAAGTAATGTVTVTGPATAAGFLRLRIGNEKFEIGFAAADTAAAIALAMKTELDKAVEDLPVLVNRTAGTLAQLTFTAKNLGTCGNDVNISTEFTLNVGVGTTNVAMASGATDPANFADALDAFQGTRYQVIGTSLNDSTNLGLLTVHLDAVSNPNVQKFGIGIFGHNTGTLATVTTLASGINHMRAMCKYLRGSLSAGYEIAAAFAALKTYFEDPNLPLNELQLFGLHVPAVASRLSAAEIETCLYNGVSPLVVDNQERVAVVRAITTDITHTQLLDVGIICALDYFRTAFITRCKDVFKRAKNTAKTPDAVVTQALFVARQLEKPGIDILRDVDLYKDKFVAEQDETDATAVRVSVPAPIVPGLQRIMARFDLTV